MTDLSVAVHLLPVAVQVTLAQGQGGHTQGQGDGGGAAGLQLSQVGHGAVRISVQHGRTAHHMRKLRGFSHTEDLQDFISHVLQHRHDTG